MSLEISPETEARSTTKARERGLSADTLLDRLLNEAGERPMSPGYDNPPELPIWNFGRNSISCASTTSWGRRPSSRTRLLGIVNRRSLCTRT